MKATAKAPANIAFIKYWGKKDDDLRLPLNPSVSMNLSGAYSVTTVDFSKKYQQDSVILLPDATVLKFAHVHKVKKSLQNGAFNQAEIARVIRGLDRIRKKVGRSEYAKVVTKNTFPKGAGSAASASGFAALTLAGFAALGEKLSEKELSIFARLGSGSACRSIPDGFVVWESEFAYSLYPPDYWDIRDILVIVDRRMKKVSTTEGMETVTTSPYLSARLAAIPKRMQDIQEAMKSKDFARFGEVIEEDCLDMHHVMQTQVPPLYYWNETTKRIMDAVRDWRTRGLPVYFTIDAGPNVHLICEGKDEDLVLEKVKELEGVEDTIKNRAAEGARLTEEHLF